MKASVFLVVILYLAVTGVASVANPGQIEWEKFSYSDFKKLKNEENGVRLIHFRKNNCSTVCQHDRRVLLENVQQLKKIEPRLKINTIDITKAPKIVEVLDLKSNTSTFLFYRGHLIRVDGYDLDPPKALDILDESIILLQKQIKEIKTVEEARKILKDEKRIHIYYGKYDSRFYRELELCDKLSNVTIYKTKNISVAKHLDLGPPAAFVHVDGEKNSTIHYQEEADYSLLIRFVVTTGKPLPQEFNIEKVREAINEGYPVVLLRGVDAEDNERIVSLILESEEFVRQHFQVFRFHRLAGEEELALQEMCRGDEEEEERQKVCILEQFEGHMSRFILGSNKLTHLQLSSFLTSFVSKELQPYLRSEKIFKKYSGRVENLNAYSYLTFMHPEEISYRDRIVLYYSSTDANSADVHAMFEKISASYSDKEVLFGRIAVDKNEIVADVASTPHIVYFTDHESEGVIKYSGELTEDALLAWIQSNLNKYQQLDTDL